MAEADGEHTQENLICLLEAYAAGARHRRIQERPVAVLEGQVEHRVHRRQGYRSPLAVGEDADGAV